MKKIYLPDLVKWPGNLGIPQRQIDFDKLVSGEYALIWDKDGGTAIRLNNHSDDHYKIRVLYQSGFIEDLHVAKPTILYGNGRLNNTDRKVLLKFQSRNVKLYLIQKDSAAINLMDQIFDYSNVWSRFICESHRLINKEYIAVKDWPASQPIFILDRYNIRRILFLQKTDPPHKSRAVVLVFKAGITRKIITTRGYIDNDSVLRLHQQFQIDHSASLSGLAYSDFTIDNMKIYS